MLRLTYLPCLILLLLLGGTGLLYADEVQEKQDAENEVIEKPESTAAEQDLLRKQIQIKGYQSVSVAGQQIDATYLEDVFGEQYGAIVILHDRGQYFETPNVVTPLRHQLPEFGWATLTVALDYPQEVNILLSASSESIDATVEEESVASAFSSALFESDGATPMQDEATEAKPLATSELPRISNKERIEALLTFIQSQDLERIVVVGHGAGGELVVELLGELTTTVNALILIGASQFTSYQMFETLEFPIIDIYGSNDFTGTRDAVKKRKRVMKLAGNQQYSIREVKGANQHFYGLQPRLADIIRSWLYKQFLEVQES